MKAREELRLVERFDELRAGMIVVVTKCLQCNGSHRGVLLRFCPRQTPSCRHGCAQDQEAAWDYSPGGAHGSRLTPWFGEDAVRDRRLFRVVDGLESDMSTTEQAPARRPRETVSR